MFFIVSPTRMPYSTTHVITDDSPQGLAQNLDEHCFNIFGTPTEIFSKNGMWKPAN
jgi:hypothetical protein